MNLCHSVRCFSRNQHIQRCRQASRLQKPANPRLPLRTLPTTIGGSRTRHLVIAPPVHYFLLDQGEWTPDKQSPTLECNVYCSLVYRATSKLLVRKRWDDWRMESFQRAPPLCRKQKGTVSERKAVNRGCCAKHTITASISSSENNNAGVFQNLSGSKCTSSATSLPFMST